MNRPDRANVGEEMTIAQVAEELRAALNRANRAELTVRDQAERIAELEQRNAELEQRNAELEQRNAELENAEIERSEG